MKRCFWLLMLSLLSVAASAWAQTDIEPTPQTAPDVEPSLVHFVEADYNRDLFQGQKKQGQGTTNLLSV